MSKCEHLIVFIKQFMNWAAFHSASRRVLQGLYKIVSFYKRKGEARKSLTKEKKGIFLNWTSSFEGEKEMARVS